MFKMAVTLINRGIAAIFSFMKCQTRDYTPFPAILQPGSFFIIKKTLKKFREIFFHGTNLKDD